MAMDYVDFKVKYVETLLYSHPLPLEGYQAITVKHAGYLDFKIQFASSSITTSSFEVLSFRPRY